MATSGTSGQPPAMRDSITKAGASPTETHPPAYTPGTIGRRTSFVGRGGAVHEVASLLDQYRLVTVTGPGGAGKTRLACELAGHVGGRFADGVWLAELAAVRDPALVASVVAVALGVRDLPGVAT